MLLYWFLYCNQLKKRVEPWILVCYIPKIWMYYLNMAIIVLDLDILESMTMGEDQVPGS